METLYTLPSNGRASCARVRVQGFNRSNVMDFVNDLWKVGVAVLAGIIVWNLFNVLFGFLAMIGVGIYLMSKQ